MNPRIPIKPSTAGRFMRLCRIVVSLVALLASSIFFSATSLKLIELTDWAPRAQIIASALTACLSTLGLWLLVTLVFGRIYCSSVCPLGTLMDIAARLPRRKRPYHYSPPLNPLRYIALLLFIGCATVGIERLTTLVDPFPAFSRMALDFLSPIGQWLGGEKVIPISAYSFVLSLLSLGALSIAAWRSGRIFCNTLCPIGVGLSIFSRVSIFHFDIDTDRCTNCRRCEYVCKAQCINLNDHVVDGSRCVACFDCVSTCPDDAIRYTRRRKQLSIPMLQRIPSSPALQSSSPALKSSSPALKSSSPTLKSSSPTLQTSSPTLQSQDPHRSCARSVSSESPHNS